MASAPHPGGLEEFLTDKVVLMLTSIIAIAALRIEH